MKELEAKNRIQKLRKEIARLRFEYHVANNPKVTDDVYESLTRELNNLENKYPQFANQNSSINRVAGKSLSAFKKVKHEIRMTSLNDIFSEKELIDWKNRVIKILGSNDFSYFCELKMDGLSASLIYENGIFIRGSTRGDGFIGEDVTENLKMIETIPLKLNPPFDDYIEVRGEVIMFKKVWQELNEKQKKEGKTTFANTRNAAVGSLRQLDPAIAQERKLNFFAWDIAKISKGKLELHSERHELLRKLGFQTPTYEKKTNNIDEVLRFIREIGEKRTQLPYGTDGMVISINELNLYDKLGIVGKAPRYMIAYKYEAERATTIITNITVGVGRTGVLTPIAHFNPTLVAGSTVSKATLHNMDQIKRLGIKISDTVVIQKAGDVIPEVVEVLINMRTGKEKEFKMPEVCPVCSSVIERKESGFSKSYSSQNLLMGGKRDQAIAHRAFAETGKSSVAYYCNNKNCPARNRRELQHFVNVFEIYEIGPKILDRLKDEGLITDAADLFTLEKSDLSGLERFGEKSADNIISSIEAHKKVPFWRFIYALGIVHVGEQTAQDLANHFKELDKLMEADEEQVNNIENIGPIVSNSIYEFFKNKNNLKFINKLFANGVSVYQEKAKGKAFSNKVFVLTGTLPSLSREEAKKIIIENGGTVSSAVSKNTNFVLVGENPGSKYNEAKKIGIKIMEEVEFLKMI